MWREHLERFSDVGLESLIVEAYQQVASVPVPESERSANNFCHAVRRVRVDPSLDLHVQPLRGARDEFVDLALINSHA